MEIRNVLFRIFFLKEKYCNSDDESLSLTVFIANGVQKLKSILTNNNVSHEDEKTKYV